MWTPGRHKLPNKEEEEKEEGKEEARLSQSNSRYDGVLGSKKSETPKKKSGIHKKKLKKQELISYWETS